MLSMSFVSFKNIAPNSYESKPFTALSLPQTASYGKVLKFKIDSP